MGRATKIAGWAAAAALLLGGCDPRLITQSDLSNSEVQTLTGVWEGRGHLSAGVRTCPPFYIWSFRVAQGSVDGEIVDPQVPNLPASTFRTYLEYDGGVIVTARPGGRETLIRGAFLRTTFRGEARNNDCSYTLRLDRKEGRS